MRGLLVKDIQLLLTNGRLFIVVICIGAMALFFGSNMLAFFVGYVTIVFSFQVCTTISYDTYEHGDAFLMTLPITRKMYVAGKYVFALISAVAGWGLGFIFENIFMLTGSADISWVETWTGNLVVLTFGLLLVGIFIPVQFKFGGDNGKMVIMAIAVAAMVSGFLIIKLVDRLGIDIDRALEYALVTKRYISFAVMLAVLAIVHAVSILCSLRIIKCKEF